MNNHNLSPEMQKILSEAGDFKPFAWHNKDGDMIEAHWKEDACYAKFINEHITILISEATKEVVGIQIECIKRLINEH